ncbi:MAG: recombination protein NinB [Azoarcus sp.]|jgi:hypothetical protein|nr:recombination protein NinB [Azoarcus sp.]
MTTTKTFILRDPRHVDALKKYIDINFEAMAKTKNPLVATLYPLKVKRSNDQNKRLLAILKEISENAWIDGKRFSTEAWHEFYKRRFIGHEDVPGEGSVGISTTSLDVAAFADYMTQIEAYAAENLGITFNY